MLTHFVHDNPARAQGYFLTGLSRADYFIEGHELPGVWQGRGAPPLGLEGEVKREEFDALCENIHPHLGERLTPRNRIDRRIAYDLCESGPKSPSIRFGLTGDTGILDAARESNRYMMSVLEKEFACGRVRAGGANEDRHTGNLVWAEFMHLTSRPVKGVPDPQIHTHNFVFNQTHDGVEERWKAAQMGRVIAACPFLDALFVSDFARRMEELGYRIEKRGKSWEIAGYSRELIEKFSHRTNEIDATAERKGIITKWLKSKLAAKTREKKNKGMTIEELRDAWEKRLSPSERATIFDTNRFPVEPPRPGLLAEAVTHVVKSCFERSALVRETTLLAEALLYQPGKLRLEEIREEMKRQGVSVRTFGGQSFATTREIAKEEQKMLDLIKAGRGRFSPVLNGTPNGSVRNGQLTPDEQRAVRHILESRDLVTIIRATPETDLKKVMAAVSKESRKKLWRGVTRVAPSAAVAREAHGRLGRKRAQTVDAMLRKTRLRFRARRSFVWIQDAGRVGTQEMTKMLRMSKPWGFRLVLTSTSRTEHGPTRGDPLHIIARHSNTSTLRLQHSSRSKGQHKEVLSGLYQDNVAGAMATLDELGRIKELPRRKALEEMARECADAHKSGRTALVIAADNAEKEKLNTSIRQRLIEAKGGLRHKGWMFATLKSRQLSEAQRKLATSYRRGDVVQFYRAAPLFKNGSRWKVIGRDPFGHVIARNGLRFEAIPLWMANRFDVFEPAQLKVQRGDMIRITKSGWAKGHGRRGRTAPLDWTQGTYSRELHANTLHRVNGLSLTGDLVLANGLTVSRTFQHFEYGYSMSANAGHRPRVDSILLGVFDPATRGVDADNIASWMAKAKKSATIYTNEKEALLNAQRRNGDRHVALDIVQPERQDRRWSKKSEPKRDRERDRDRERTMEH